MTELSESAEGVTRPRVVIVTGAGGGIGRELVEGFLKQGFRVIATDNEASALEKIPVPSELSPFLERMIMDVCHRGQVESVCESLRSRHGGIDVLINNAGIFRKSSILSSDPELDRLVIEVNLLGAMTCMSVFGAEMSRNRSGRIINIASIAGVTGGATCPAYAASKAGLIAVTRSAARELGDRGITVNAIAPGYCDTPMLAPDKGMIQAFTVPRIPLKRIAQPVEVAEVAIFLGTCQTTYLTGCIITLDGGLHVG